MSDTHTPGPWEVDWIEWNGQAERTVSDSITGEQIALVPFRLSEDANDSSDEELATDEAETYARARLIAAAPDLLSALRQLVDYVEETEGRFPTNDDHPLFAARAALSRATQDDA